MLLPFSSDDTVPFTSSNCQQDLTASPYFSVQLQVALSSSRTLQLWASPSRLLLRFNRMLTHRTHQKNGFDRSCQPLPSSTPNVLFSWRRICGYLKLTGPFWKGLACPSIPWTKGAHHLQFFPRVQGVTTRFLLKLTPLARLLQARCSQTRSTSEGQYYPNWKEF